MPRHLHKTLIDYLIIAISPALIIALVDSLVLFLEQVFYQGGFTGRLGYVLTLFVIGATLIARISIEDGRERAALFAVPLGIVTLMAIFRFVQFQGGWAATLNVPINIGLIGLIWWAADKLTWDCTLIDEQEEDSGEGLIETIGLDRPDRAALQFDIAPASVEIEATTSRDDRSQTWWDRYIERRRRPHAPGLWVVYFSLAALPLFGIGQFFLPAGDLSARQRAFQLLFVYTASGLGLLLTTSFLGLRRYLRQRRQEMPVMMVNLWLTLGGAMIVGVMAATMLLPRPNAEYAVSQLPFRIGSPDQKSSRHAVGRDGVEEKQPWARGEPSNEETDKTVPGKDEGKAPSSNGEESSGEKGNQTDRGAKESHGADEPSQGAKPKTPGSDRESPQPSEGRDSNETKPGHAEASEEGSPKSEQATPSDESSPSGDSQPLQAFPQISALRDSTLLANFAKLVAYGLLGIWLLALLWYKSEAVLAGLQNIGNWLLNFWLGLFGISPSSRQGDNEQTPVRIILPRFADYPNPFATGTASNYRPEELVRYTFEALEAWGREHDCPRHTEQTPHEFVRTLPPSLGDEAGRLAELYCRVAYASGTVSPESAARLAALWQALAAFRQSPANP